MPNIPIHLSFGCETSHATSDEKSLRLDFGVRVLSERRAFNLALPGGTVQSAQNCVTLDTGDLVAGFLRGTAGQPLEDSVEQLYDAMLGVLGSRSLYRIWHFVPRINACELELENYRLFCRGRAEAFRRAFGDSFDAHLPAASAVGSEEDEPVMMFVGGVRPPNSAENPEQVPAYHYPPFYGPRAPSFARASRVVIGNQEVVFISGTASIKGSETVHPGHCGKQTVTTLHNLALISQSVGLGLDLGRSRGIARHFVIYIRREEDFSLVRNLLEERLLAPDDERIYLQADICRSDLMVEIEATMVMPLEDVPPPG